MYLVTLYSNYELLCRLQCLSLVMLYRDVFQEFSSLPRSPQYKQRGDFSQSNYLALDQPSMAWQNTYCNSSIWCLWRTGPIDSWTTRVAGMQTLSALSRVLSEHKHMYELFDRMAYRTNSPTYHSEEYYISLPR